MTADRQAPIGKPRLGAEEEALLVELYLHPFGRVGIETRHVRSKRGEDGGLRAADVNRLWRLRSKGLVERVHASLRRWELTAAGLEVAKVLAVKERLTHG